MLAMLGKESGDHGPTLRNGLLIAAFGACVVAAFGREQHGAGSIPVGLAAIIWLAGIVAMVLAPDGERGGRTFLPRQPCGLGFAFAGKLAFIALAGVVLLGPAFVLTGAAALASLGEQLPGILALAGGTLAVATTIPRGVLAVAGGPIALAPAFLVWNDAGLLARDLLQWAPGMLAFAAAGLGVAATGFVRGRSRLAPASRPARCALLAAIPAYSLALIPVAWRADELTRLNAGEFVIHGGTVDDDGAAARLIVSRVGSSVRLPARLDLRRDALARDGKPQHPRHGPRRDGPTLHERLTKRREHDNLLRTTRGERFWIERDVLHLRRIDGSLTRLEIGFDWPVAVRGDALLLCAHGFRVGEHVRCRVVDLARGEVFAEPLFDPDAFCANDGAWYLADAELRNWRARDPRNGVETPLPELRDGTRVIAAMRGGALLVERPGEAAALFDPSTRAITPLIEPSIARLRPESDSLCADGTLLLRVEHGGQSWLTSLAPGATSLGPRIACGLVLGAIDASMLLATDRERRTLLRVVPRTGTATPLALRIEEAAR